MDARPAVSWHNKHHLVPFSEFFPVPEFIRSWLKLQGCLTRVSIAAQRSRSRSSRGPAHRAGVCYEGRLRVHTAAGDDRATMLLNVTNDSWFARSTARYQHLQISRCAPWKPGGPWCGPRTTACRRPSARVASFIATGAGI
jgi:apolipoprotein N-acyltransferase